MTVLTIHEIERVAALPAGYEARPASHADIPALIELFNRCDRRWTGEDGYKTAMLETEWGVDSFDPADRTRVVLQEGTIVGYAEVWHRAPYVQTRGWWRVAPEHENGPAAAFLLDWYETYAASLMTKAPPEARVVVGADTNEKHEWAKGVLVGRGYTIARHFFRMVIEFDEAPQPVSLPDGLTLRTMRPEEADMRRTYRAIRDSFRDHYGYVEGSDTGEAFEKRYKDWKQYTLNDEDFLPDLFFLAEAEDGTIAGVNLCYPTEYGDDDMGWVDVLGVRPAYRRRGLALALLSHSFDAFYGMGKKRAGLGVDAGSLTGAVDLYRKAGMTPARRSDYYEKVLRDGVDLVRK